MEITQNTILKLIVRQGSNDDRNQIILTSGEPGYATDTQRLFIGDGFTTGGVLVGNKFKGFNTDLVTLAPAEIGDYAFDTDNNSFFILESNDGSTLSDWRQVAGVYTGSTYIFVDPSTNQLTLLPLSAGIFDNDAVEAPIILSSGRIALSAKIDYERVSTHTITVSSGLKAFDVDGNELTFHPLNPLSGDIFITVGELSAGMFSSDTTGYALSVDENGRLAVDAARTMTIAGGLTATVDGVVDVTGIPVSPLSGNISFGIAPPEVLSILSQSIDPPLYFTGSRFIVALSSIPLSGFGGLFTKTITVSSGLAGFSDGIDITNVATSPISANIIIKVGELSAGMFSSDALDSNLTLNNGRIALSTTIPFQYVSTKTITVSSGLNAYVDGTFVDAIPVNALSSNLTIVSNDVLARYDGLSGQVVSYSRNLISVTRLSAGDYNFNYSVPTSSVYVSVDVIGLTVPTFLPRVMSTSSTVCNVQLLSSTASVQRRDGNIFFRLTY